MTTREIDDFSRWAQLTSSCIAKVSQLETRSVHAAVVGETVDTPTTNSRLRTVCNYLCWLIEDCGGCLETKGDFDFHRQQKNTNSVISSFTRQLNAARKLAPVASLTEQQTASFRAVLVNPDSYRATSHGRRDRLITRLFYDTGLPESF